MDRPIIYTQEQGRTFDILSGYKDTLSAIGYAAQDNRGPSTTVVSGFAATASLVPDMHVNIAAGRIYQVAAFDNSPYGALPADSTPVPQQGSALPQQLTFSTSALSAGQSQWALIEVGFAQVDEIAPNDPTGGLLYYYNSSNPAQPFQGPGNNGLTQPTLRQGTTSVRILYGTPAATGAEVPPNPDSGYVPLYLIDLTFGQTSITNVEIIPAGPSVGVNVPSIYPYAPFLAGLLASHHGGTTGQAPKINLMTETQPLTQSLTTNGYVLLPSGLIMQWGIFGTTTGNGDTLIFPIAFPNACLMVVTDEASANGWVNTPPQPTWTGSGNVTASNCKIWAIRLVSGTPQYGLSDSVAWIAIGH